LWFPLIQQIITRHIAKGKATHYRLR
jgi:hypothetical protein